MCQPQGVDLDTIVLCGKRDKELESIPVGDNGMVAHPSDVGEVVVEELMDARGKFHIFHFCQMVKS